MDKFINIKTGLFAVVAVFGGMFSDVLGGFDKILMALLICMIADYITGLIVALVFKNSTKTETGAAQSKAGFIGIVKKIFVLILIVVINQIDIVTNTNGFLRDAAIMGFIANEVLSLIENAGLMGIKLPEAVTNAIDVLKNKSESRE
ncbi:phage holin family protein [Clostridium cellulovorans]|uniref:Toxin secretion/phage lysis holin n=1 Tax=Clostridium cellulovorans (strain ATCC 35296 / DSM 3052 / OCM 3 / 743B) TaxID=573061 RepID=D9SQ02_CLOC7|nr:phage holin family protein [Clostridium cellulovorans]ADL52138.1 toxin secretion/phage lysis holin [Clostridium cellulovorans 743B]